MHPRSRLLSALSAAALAAAILTTPACSDYRDNVREWDDQRNHAAYHPDDPYRGPRTPADLDLP